MTSKKGFWDHLDDVREVLFRIVIVCVIAAIGYLIAMPYLFEEVILAPCDNDFIFYKFLRVMGRALSLEGSFFAEEFAVELINIDLAAQLFIHISTAFYLSIVTIFPYVIYEIWSYIAPALYRHERSNIRKALALGTGMFYLGIAVAYLVVYPMTLRFLSTYQLSASIDNIISLTSYIDNFMMLILLMGLAFEIPLVMWVLSLMGVIRRGTLRRYRRHAIAIVVILASIITPTGDPFTLAVVAIPLYLLFELSVVMVKRDAN